MRDTFVHYSEVLLLRAGPGLLNLATLMYLGAWLGPSNYGVYSTTIAAAAFASSMLFGPLSLGIVSQHATHETSGRSVAYESGVVSGVLLMAAAVLILGLFGMLLGLIQWVWIAPVAAFGVYTSIQEILHARLRLWAFGGAALSQAALFAILTWLLVNSHREVDAALAAYSASYAVAAAVSWLLCGLPRLAWPDRSLLHSSLVTGGQYTLGTAAEQSLSVGVRVSTGLLGTGHHLGVISFCVDVAQRLVGFLINAVAFRVIPAAFKASSDPQYVQREFRETLLAGAGFAAVIAGLSLVSILAIQRTHLVPALNTSLFDPTVFTIVSAAVIINRLKKLLLDPFAMRQGKLFCVTLGYVIASAMTLAIGTAVIATEGGRSAKFVYLFAYAVAAGITFVALKRAGIKWQ